MIGINYESVPIATLAGCISDAERIHSFLIEKDYPESSILLLTDKSGVKSSRLPNKENILKAFRWLLSAAPASDFENESSWDTQKGPVKHFFHYSGHGSQVRDSNDTIRGGFDDTICPLDIMSVGQILDTEIRTQLVDKIRSDSSMYCTFDCCHSGTIMDLPFVYKTRTKGIEKCGKTSEPKAEILCLSACFDSQTSADLCINNVNTGITTAAFLYCMSLSGDLTYRVLIDTVREFATTNHIFSQQATLSFSHNHLLEGTFSL